MTIARAEMSTNKPSLDSQGTVESGMAVALIGPNDAHRKVVAKALATAQGRKVHEFVDYPADLNDLARMMETKFDVVLVDVDTDESYALQIIAKLSDFGPAVMAYSARTDQELLASCMRAGAVDFLPLPTEEGISAEPAPQQPAPAPPMQQVAPKVTAAKAAPVPTPPPPAPRSNVTSIAPERYEEPVREMRPPAPSHERFTPPPAEDLFAPPGARSFVPPAPPTPVEEPKTEKDDFAAWDKANLRPPASISISKAAETRPRPSLVPDRKKDESAPRVAPAAEEKTPAPAPPIERPPVQVGIFRSTAPEVESAPNETAEKQGAKWVKWILIGAGPVVLGLVLLIVFTRPTSQSPAPAHPAAKEVAAETIPTEPKAAADAQLIVSSTGKTESPAPAIAKPSPATTQASAPEDPEAPPVSPDAMAEQLVAPRRIAGSIKRAPAADEPPPAAPAAAGLGDGGSISGSVFGASTKAKYAPNVVAISAGVADGMILHKTTPIYPKFAQEAHITGKVVLKATITKQGNIEGVQVLSGPKILAPSAADAVKTWKYRPYLLDGQPVAVETNITVVFGISGK